MSADDDETRIRQEYSEEIQTLATVFGKGPEDVEARCHGGGTCTLVVEGHYEAEMDNPSVPEMFDPLTPEVDALPEAFDVPANQVEVAWGPPDRGKVEVRGVTATRLP